MLLSKVIQQIIELLLYIIADNNKKQGKTKIIEGILPLRNDLSTDALVDNDTQSVGSNIVNSSSLAVVYFVRHTLLYTTVTLQKTTEVMTCKVNVV